MNCKESFELIIERAAGRLSDDRAADLAGHIEGCNNCRFELEATQWLARKLRGHNTRLKAGHQSIYNLFKFVDDPDSFDEDAVESIWEHLDSCDACLDDFDYLKDLIAVPPEKRQAFAQAIIESQQNPPAARSDAGTDVTADPSRETSREADTAASSEANSEPISEASTGVSAVERGAASAGAPHVVVGAPGPTGADAPSSSVDSAVGVEMAEPPATDPSASSAAAHPATGTTPTGAAKEARAKAAAGEPGAAKPGSGKPGAAKPGVSRAGVRAGHRPKSTGPLGPVRDFFAGIAAAIVSQPRNAAIAGGGIVIGLIVVVSLMNKAGVVGSSSVAQWETSEVFSTNTPVQEVPVSLVRRGKGRPVSTDVDLRGIASMVIAVDLDLVDGTAMTYDAVIYDPEGAEVFREEIGTEYFMQGRLLLRLSARHFRPGAYGFVIDTMDRGGIVQTMARGTFYVQR